LKEKLVVVEAHTIADPRAVVIHSEDALPTNRAVVSSRWLYLFAFLAELVEEIPFKVPVVAISLESAV